MRAIFVRHGQSTGNAGIPCDDLGSIPLTELGWKLPAIANAERIKLQNEVGGWRYIPASAVQDV